MSTPEELRRALERRAGRVSTAPDALQVIRERISAGRRRARVWTVTVAGLATAAAAAAVALMIALPSGSPPVRPPGPGVGSPAPTAVVPGGPSLPVYLVGTVDGRPVLFREYHTLPGVGAGVTEQIRAALTDMIAGHHLDPDYRAGWPPGATVRSVQAAGDTISVDLSVPAGEPADPGLALQELVHTATAVGYDAGQSQLVRVRLSVEGRPAIWGIDVSQPLTRSSSVDTLAPVWLYWPQEGDSVPRTFTVQIVGTVPGAVATLVVSDAAGNRVVDRSVPLDKDAPQRGTGQSTVTLGPGRYRIEAYYLGDDGQPAGLDDHLITVG